MIFEVCDVPTPNIFRRVETPLITKYGNFLAIGYEEYNNRRRLEHVALVMGDVQCCIEPVMVRVHSKCMTGEVFGSLRCDCAQQLDFAMTLIGRAGRGVLVYLDQEGRGIGLLNKLKAYYLQTHFGYDTIRANHELGFATDLRDHRVAACILSNLKINNVALLTNNPEKVRALREAGFIVDVIPINVLVPEEARYYVHTKVEKLGHFGPNGIGTETDQSLVDNMCSVAVLDFKIKS